MVNSWNRSQTYGANNINSWEAQERSATRQGSHSHPLSELALYVFHTLQKKMDGKQKGASASSKCNGQVYFEYVNVTLLVLTKLCLAKKGEHYQTWSHLTIRISFGNFIGLCNDSQEFNYQSRLFSASLRVQK